MPTYKVTLLKKGALEVPYIQIKPASKGTGRDYWPSGTKLYEMCFKTGRCTSAFSPVSMNAPCIPSQKCPHQKECENYKTKTGHKDRQPVCTFFVELEKLPRSPDISKALSGVSFDDAEEIAIRLIEVFSK